MNAAAAILSMLLTSQVAAAPPAKITAELYASHDAAARGGSIEVAIELEVPKPWHVYHPIILDTGFATQFEWTLPEGVSISAVRLPAPSLGEAFDMEYLGLEGKFAGLATLRVAADAKVGERFTIVADISALACIEQCVPVNTKASLEIRVGDEAKPEHEALFRETRRGLAPLLESAPYLKGSSLKITPETLKIDEPGELVATIVVRAKHHIQDRNPGNESLIAARLFIEKVDGIEFGEQVWPDAHTREIEYVGKVREQSGTFKIRAPLKITKKDFPAGPHALRVLFRYQCCTDAGQCYPPEMAEAFVRFNAASDAGPGAQAAIPAAPSDAPDKIATAPPAADDSQAKDKLTNPAPASSGTSLPVALVLGFLGGLILNVMPCVLPVISIKIISFVQQADEDPRRVFRLGLAFCAGIMIWFWCFALLSMTGRLPLQYPLVVLAIGTVIFLLALNMFGVFEIMLPGAAAGTLDAVTHREGYGGAFLKGFLATLLGTACTAPFLAGALVYAATQPRFVGMLVFSAAGLGMACPYLLLCANPAWLKYVPKPGAWMVSFKQAMGFVLIGTVVWLLWVLSDLLDGDAVIWTVGFWSFLAFAVWLIGKGRPTHSSTSRLTRWAVATATVAAGYWFSYQYMYDLRGWVSGEVHAPAFIAGGITPQKTVELVASKGWEHGIPWAPYRPGLAAELAEMGYTVYVDYTATWCATCLANKASSLETNDIRGKMRELGVIPLEADFTRRDAELLAEIQRYGRSSVPLNLVYPAGRADDPIVLPVVLRKSIVSDALDRAGASQHQSRVALQAP